MTRQLLDVHSAITERAALLVRFGDLGFKGYDAFQPWLDLGHGCLLLLAGRRAVRAPGALCARAPFTVTVLPWPAPGAHGNPAGGRERAARTSGRAVPRFSYSISPDLPSGSRQQCEDRYSCKRQYAAVTCGQVCTCAVACETRPHRFSSFPVVAQGGCRRQSLTWRCATGTSVGSGGPRLGSARVGSRCGQPWWSALAPRRQ